MKGRSLTRLALGLLVLAGGCGTQLVDPCAGVSGACLTVHVDPSPGVTSIDALDVNASGFSDQQVAANGGAAMELPVAVGLAFDHLAASTKIDLTVTGGLAGQVVGTVETQVVLMVGEHQTIHVQLTSAGGDLAAPPDLAPAQVAVPRLLAPLSTSKVTQRQPTLRWTLGPGSGTAIVDLCRDRACTQPIAIPLSPSGASPTAAAPTMPLPVGWVFWRVRVVDGTDTKTSATWQLLVGARSASTPVDVGHGTTLDVNGDGYADALLGDGTKVTHLFQGGSGGLRTWIDLQSPDGSNAAEFGFSVAPAGDLDGDGFCDFIIGSNDANSFAGAAHVYFGGASPKATDWNGTTAPRRIDLDSPAGGTGEYGYAVSGLGDVDGDGYGDFLIIANQGHAAYVYFGGPQPSASGWNGPSAPKRIDLTSPEASAYYFGSSGAAAGDVNGDGYADFLVGSPGEAGSPAGAAHVYLGGPTPTAGAWNGASAARRIDLSDPLPDGPGFSQALSGAGDVDGDGYSDFLIATPFTGSNAGSAHLYFGEPSPSASHWNGSVPSKRVDLVSPDGTSGQFGSVVAPAGDVDGDGYGDFCVGSYNGGGNGPMHLYLGSGASDTSTWYGTTASHRFNLANLDGPASGFGTTASFSSSTAGLGDTDGDGYADFFVGASGAVSGNGVAHVYRGEHTPNATHWNGTTASQRTNLPDTDGADALYGLSAAGAL